MNVLRYGNTRQAVLGLEVVLPNGEVLDLLKGLRSSATAWVAVDSPEAAVMLLARLRTAVGERISSFELISRPMLELVLAHRSTARDPLTQPSDWYVLMEWSDALASFDMRTLMEDTLGLEMDSGLITDAAIAENLMQAEQFWTLRESVTEAQRAEGAGIKHDVSIAISSIPRFLEQANAAVAASLPQARVIAFGHVGEGNVHYNVLQAPGGDGEAFEHAMQDVSRQIYDITVRLGGSISAEHGLGQIKAVDAFSYKSAPELRLMRAIKATFDPKNLMNRGKMLPP